MHRINIPLEIIDRGCVVRAGGSLTKMFDQKRLLSS